MKGVHEQIRYHPQMVTGFQEELPYCSTGASSGEQKSKRSTSQSKFRSENITAKSEADAISSAVQQLVSNIYSANLNNNISTISKLPKLFTTTMPTFYGKSEELDLFEDLLETSLKNHNQLTEEKKLFPVSHAS